MRAFLKEATNCTKSWTIKLSLAGWGEGVKGQTGKYHEILMEGRGTKLIWVLEHGIHVTVINSTEQHAVENLEKSK